MIKKQKISCEVFDCKHCICDEYRCNLEEIKICNCDDFGSKESTMCHSYKKRKR